MADKVKHEQVSVGDHVRLKTFLANEHGSYTVTDTQFTSRRDAVNGLVLSIREIKTGKLVTSTKGRLDGYVFELVFDNTFNSRFASLRNAQRGIDRVTATPGWRRLHAALRELGEKGELIATTTPGFLTESPLAKMLDGWKIVKVRSNEIENLEKADSEAETDE